MEKINLFTTGLATTYTEILWADNIFLTKYNG